MRVKIFITADDNPHGVEFECDKVEVSTLELVGMSTGPYSIVITDRSHLEEEDPLQ